MRRAGVAVLAWICLGCTFMGLGNLIQPGTWQVHLFVLPALVTAVMWGITALIPDRHRAIAAIVSLVAGLVVWVFYLTGIASDGRGVWPTREALGVVRDNLRAAVDALPDYARPATNPELFLPLGLLGLGPMCVLAVWMALGLRRPAWLGLPALACWVVFLTGDPARGTGWVVAAGAVYLLLLGVSPRRAGAPRRLRVAAAPLAIVATLAGLVGGLAAPYAPGWGNSGDWLNFWNSTYIEGTGLSVNGPVQVGDQLRSQSSVVVFRTRGDYAGVLAMGSLTEFDGTAWRAGPSSPQPYDGGEVGDTGQDIKLSYNPDGSLSSVTVTQRWPGPEWTAGGDLGVRIAGLVGRVVPTSPGPRAVQFGPGSALTYDPLGDEFRLGHGLRADESYTVTTHVLDRSDLGTQPGLDPAVMPYAQMPGDDWVIPHAAEIQALTERIIGSADTQDAKLQAIQAYLRGPGFTYTLTPHWDGTGDPVWAFLTAKQGYCVQYATAMAIMGHLAGIPMRVTVGYLPGVLGNDGWRTVSGAQAHMWPEAYYPGLGWVGYEPTPGVSQAVIAGAGPTSSPTSGGPSASVTPTMPSSAAPSTTPTPGPGGSKGGPTWAMVWPWLAGIGGGLAGVAALVGLVWLVVQVSYSPERAWTVMRRRGIKVGVLDEGTSVRAGTGRLALRASAVTGLPDLRDAIEARRYAPPGTAATRGVRGRRWWVLKTAVVRSLRPAR